MNAQEFYIKTRDGIDLRVRGFFLNKKVTVIALHGIAEHLGRHSYLEELFSESFNLVQFDLRGHGKSGGRKGYIKDFVQYLEDLEDLISYLEHEKQIKEYMLFAHSMGSLISWLFLRHTKIKNLPLKVFLCAPPVMVPGRLGKLLPQTFLKGVLKLPLKLWLPRPFSISTLSHDPQVKRSVEVDSLCLSVFSKQLVVGLAHASKEAFSSEFSPACPVAVAIGSEDKIVHSPRVLEYFSKCGEQITLKCFEGAYHELHNEIETYRRPYFEFVKNFFK